MLLGHVRDGHPRISLSLPGIHGTIESEFIVDTGFEGDLAIPESLITRLNADLSGSDTFALADGSRLVCPTYDLVLEWSGESRVAEVLATSGQPLIGTQLLDNMLIQIEMVEAGEVSVEPL